MMPHFDDLLPDPRNPRTITPEAADGLRTSLDVFGDLAGITWNERTGQLVAGHQRMDAIRALAETRGVSPRVDGGMIVLPAGGGQPEERFALRVVDWEPIRQTAANIAANNPAIAGAFTAQVDELLAQVQAGLPELFAELRMDEIAALARGDSAGTAPDDLPEPQVDRAAELAREWGTAPGQVWEVPSLTVPGRCHRVACGDSTDREAVGRLLAGETAWMMVTDPPYGVEYDPGWRNAGLEGNRHATSLGVGLVSNDHRAGWAEAYALFPGDVAYVWHAMLFSSTVRGDIEEQGFGIRSEIIWSKAHFVISRGDYHPQHEACWYAVRKGQPARRNDDRTQSTVWEIASLGAFGRSADEGDAATGHGTQKPVECMARPIRNHDHPAGSSVYDPFLGSGTTLLAAEREGRICLGMELDPGYVAVILQRCKDAGLDPKRSS